MGKFLQLGARLKENLRKNFRSATINFVFIFAFINVFQFAFGPENTIVGVIFAIMMPASMLRDMTATPLRHLGIQAGVFFLMTAGACFVSNVPGFWALPVNLAVLFLILYAFTFEYVNHLYFPYLLSYLFLVFISPISPDQLPKRLLGVFAGAVCIMLYQWINGRHRLGETARDMLLRMIDQADECVDCLLSSEGIPRDPEQLRAELCKLSKIIYDRRRKALCISDASFSMIDSGRGLENLVLLLYEMEGPVTPERAEMLEQISAHLSRFKTFLLQPGAELPPIPREAFDPADSAEAGRFYQCMLFIRRHIHDMTLPERKKHYRKTLLSLPYRLKAALHVSPMRLTYALRVSCLLALCTLFVQLLALPHGKWLLFTVASVSLPYADDVGTKAKKRIVATLIGGLFSVAAYALIPSAMGRTAVMMLSGYLSCFFSEYAITFACSTLGALGGAVFLTSFGWGGVGTMSLIRLAYIAVGIVVGLVGNLVIFPFPRSKATRQLLHKYVSITELLTKICQNPKTDPQLYYALVIQAHLLEDKLCQNAGALNWEGAKDLLRERRGAVRAAHLVGLDPELVSPKPTDPEPTKQEKGQPVTSTV